MSVLSLGTMTIGGRDRFAKMGNLGVDDTRRILDVCREAGVTTIDTADVYSSGGPEEILGEALRDDATTSCSRPRPSCVSAPAPTTSACRAST